MLIVPRVKSIDAPQPGLPLRRRSPLLLTQGPLGTERAFVLYGSYLFRVFFPAIMSGIPAFWARQRSFVLLKEPCLCLHVRTISRHLSRVLRPRLSGIQMRAMLLIRMQFGILPALIFLTWTSPFQGFLELLLHKARRGFLTFKSLFGEPMLTWSKLGVLSSLNE